MTVAKITSVLALLATVSVVGAGAFTFRLLAAERQQEAAKKPAANSEAFNRLKLEMTQKELIQVQADLRKTRLELKFWSTREETFAKLHIPNSEIEAFSNQDPVIAKYLLKISELRDQLAQTVLVAKDPKTSPEVKNLQNDIMANEKIIEGLRKILHPHIVAQLREKAVDQFKGRLIQFKEQIEFNEQLAQALEAEIERLNALLAPPGK
jgi:hypothetical protein